LLEWLAPADSAAHAEFGKSAYWLRVGWESGDYPLAPRLSRVLFNTTLALQAVTVQNEILGSSDGSEDQRFRSIRTPLLAGERLEVRERELPAAAEQMLIKQAVGDDAITITEGGGGRPGEISVRWERVADFYGSGPRDRHYVLDALSGEIRFGNGRNGLIPPVGTGNIRLAYYRTGGGLLGNRAANSIIQLKTTVPYVDRVTNHEPAVGGAEAEDLDSLLQRAPRALRHRHRAVSLEDYEDLALLASPEVARARCVPLHDLANDPDASQFRPGTVSLIVVPRTSDVKPVPSLTLLHLVKIYLDQRYVPTADLVIVGPEYVRVDVAVEVALLSREGASAVESDVAQTLARFLHPLTGALDRNGWDFGRKPHASDLYALLEAVPGVDHLRSLQVTETEERPGALASGRFLVYAGSHDIRLTFAET
jgi:predicted phage baseplate assembly protein